MPDLPAGRLTGSLLDQGARVLLHPPCTNPGTHALTTLAPTARGPSGRGDPGAEPLSARTALRPLVRALARRIGPALPRRLQEGVLAARSWTAAGVALGLPRVDRAVVLAPHPDDESAACGGTIALLADAGAEVTVVFATDGEGTLGSTLPVEEIARARRSEGERAAALLGAVGTRALGHPDLGLAGRVPALTGDIRELLRAVRPQLVLLPWFLDASEDHRALNLALAGAAPGEDVDVWGGEVWSPLPANRIVDISSSLDRKREALAVHSTAHGAIDLSAVVGLNRYRSLQGLRGVGHAEAFLAVPGPQYSALVTDVLGLVEGRVTVRNGAERAP